MCLAIPGLVEEIFETDGLKMAKVNFGGIKRAVCLQYTPEASLGSYVLVHVGFAISLIDEVEAGKTLRLMKEFNELDEVPGLENLSQKQIP